MGCGMGAGGGSGTEVQPAKNRPMPVARPMATVFRWERIWAIVMRCLTVKRAMANLTRLVSGANTVMCLKKRVLWLTNVSKR